MRSFIGLEERFQGRGGGGKEGYEGFLGVKGGMWRVSCRRLWRMRGRRERSEGCQGGRREGGT